MVVVIIGIVAVAAVVIWFFFNRQHPENAAGHATPADDTNETTSDRLYRGADRPAGPDAEPMDPGSLGGDQSPPSD